LLQERQADCRLVLRQVFDHAKQLQVFLAHDLVKLRSLHPGLLHLLERLASINALMLARVAVNPASRIRRKAENNQTVRFLTKEEEGRIRAVLAPRCPSCLPAFIVSLHTGLRASEQWNLRWSDIDPERKTLTVRKQKSGKGERHIRLNELAVAAFESIREGADLTGVPFLNSRGTPMTTHRDWFDPAVAEAKVPDYTWHKNRHTFASRLAMAGVDIRTIAQLMGHGTIQMSMRYAHLSPDHNQSAVDRLVEFGPKGTPKRTPGKLKI
jgi:integrase